MSAILVDMNRRIEPFQVYTTPEAADLLGTSEMNLIDMIKKGMIQAKIIGKGYKVLGENLLSYVGSPTISRMQPSSYTGGVPTGNETPSRDTSGAATTSEPFDILANLPASDKSEFVDLSKVDPEK